jgi:ribose transport system ATP-binding protein
MLRRWLVDGEAEARMGVTWQERLAIQTPDMGKAILSLSGGNQQKALFARALGSRADIILMDDPMRGVDVGTKREVYGLIREEAARGRTFLWYTTETDELEHCDHVYVFREGSIVADLSRHELTEEKVLHASFKDDV